MDLHNVTLHLDSCGIWMLVETLPMHVRCTTVAHQIDIQLESGFKSQTFVSKNKEPSAGD